ncbi:hypothetical protein [Nocardia abscessus]|uniref:hypothetical protein n=1 Tax=Nocardia abscessus TaxID=120957 RepID=UPI002455AE4F|nr:hypothetical protein [Nocardia abscessus]
MKGTSEGSARPATASNAANGTGTIPYRPPAQLPRRTENTAAPTAVDEAITAQEAFARLAPLLAARRSMRLWNPSLDRYNDRARTLTRKLPDQPAAVPIYRDGRTRLLALDFDSTRGGPAAVDREVERCLGWVREAGGRAITDHSTSGGRHILIPLPLGDTLDLAEAESLVRALAARLPSLDITPMLNPATGCITPPGSRCKQGGYRRLDGSLDDALDALTARSAPGFVARLRHLVAGTAHEVTTARGACAIPRAPRAADDITREVRLWEGEGEGARLRAEYRRRSPLSPTIEGFARDGAAPADGRWTTRAGRVDRSAARQSVLASALVRGYSYLDVRAQLPAAGGSWRGFADAYRRYGRGADAAMHRDWISACRWAEHTVPEFLSVTHKQKDTGGTPRLRPAARLQQRWLAAATVWVHAQWSRSPRRWTVLAVLQALAWASAVGGQVARGVPVVEFGGRSLSLAAGGLPESTVWGVLRELRDMPGAPILRIRSGRRLHADRYALVTAHYGHRPGRPHQAQISRARVEPVHPAWKILGLHCRRIHELITHDGLTTPTDVFAAACMSPSAGYNALAVLTTAGLVSHTHGHLQPGSTGLDAIAHAHGLRQERMQRLARHHQHRAVWKRWLAHRDGPACPPIGIHAVRAWRLPTAAVNVSWTSAQGGRQPNPYPGTALAPAVLKEEIPRSGGCSSATDHAAAAPVARTALGSVARAARPPKSGKPERRGCPELSAQRAHTLSSGLGECAPATSNLITPCMVVEVYVEGAGMPIAGGRWLVAADSTVYYERPTGVMVPSTVPIALLRHSPSWTCVFRDSPIDESPEESHP